MSKYAILTLFFSFYSVIIYAGNDKIKKYQVTNNERQTIDGFGASDAWSFRRIGTWEDSLQTQVADWLFSKEKGIGLSIWRFNAGTGSATQGDSACINHDMRTEYFSGQTGQRTFLRLAKERGVPIFLAFYNSPPVFLTENGLATNTGRGGTLNLRSDAFRDFAIYVADMIESMKNEDGIYLDYVCPVNEPDGHWNWQGPKQEGTPATNREVAQLVREMNRELLERGITTKILINESSDYRCMIGEYGAGWQRGNEIQCFWNPDSLDTYIGNLSTVAHIMAGHSYWTNTPVLKPYEDGYDSIGLYGWRRRLADAFDKVDTDFWMTELCIMSNDVEVGGGGGFDFSMQTALYVARVMHYDLTVANARSWQWWRAAGENYKDGLIRMYSKGERIRSRNGSHKNIIHENMVRASKLMWTIGNYSRFIRPKAVRLEVCGDMEIDGVMLSAYRNLDGSIVVVALNYANEDKDVFIDVYGKSTAVAYRTSDVEGENLKNIGTVNIKNMALAARSVTTFIFR